MSQQRVNISYSKYRHIVDGPAGAQMMIPKAGKDFNLYTDKNLSPMCWTDYATNYVQNSENVNM